MGLEYIESTLDRIATAMEKIAGQAGGAPVIAKIEPDAPMPEPTPGKIEPLAAIEPVKTNSKAPFSTATQMQEYVKQSYNDLGSEKGKQMIEIMKQMNVASIKDMQPEQYGDFYEKVEQLKAS